MLIADELTITMDDWTGRYSLSGARGGLAAMVGPSGGGKSTLLHAIAGFERPAGGSLTFDGIDLLPLKPAARPVAIVFQDHNLLPNLTAQQNAGLALSPALRLSATDRVAIAAMLEHVGLAGMGERLPSELSGGQRRRVALARAMLTTRPLLLLDEPLTGLDPAMHGDMVDLIDKLRREKALTVLMTTHTPDDVQARADQVIRIAEGQVVES
jgi:thiamine transport system ATP-binding protein